MISTATDVGDGVILSLDHLPEFGPAPVPVLLSHANQAREMAGRITDLRMGPSARCIVTSRRWYESLAPELRAAVQTAVGEARAANRAWAAQAVARERAMLEKAGIEWLEMEPAARDEWRDLTRKIERTRWETPEAEARLKAMIDIARAAEHSEGAP